MLPMHDESDVNTYMMCAVKKDDILSSFQQIFD